MTRFRTVERVTRFAKNGNWLNKT